MSNGLGPCIGDGHGAVAVRVRPCSLWWAHERGEEWLITCPSQSPLYILRTR